MSFCGLPGHSNTGWLPYPVVQPLTRQSAAEAGLATNNTDTPSRRETNAPMIGAEQLPNRVDWMFDLHARRLLRPIAWEEA